MTTKDVLDHHLDAFRAGDLEGVMADYAEESLFVSPNAVAHGTDEIRAVFTRLFGGLFAPGTYELTVDMEHVEGEIAYLLWHAACAAADVPFASDTFVVRDGSIRVQTVAITVEPRSA